MLYASISLLWFPKEQIYRLANKSSRSCRTLSWRAIGSTERRAHLFDYPPFVRQGKEVRWKLTSKTSEKYTCLRKKQISPLFYNEIHPFRLIKTNLSIQTKMTPLLLIYLSMRLRRSCRRDDPQPHEAIRVIFKNKAV